MDDGALALALQQEYDREIIHSDEGWVNSSYSNDFGGTTSKFSSGATIKSIVDPAWELLDPNPDIRSLFQEFNAAYFWGKLSMVEVRWSPRMTLCAGLCCYEGRGGLCSVRLSQPLHRLRPRKDLVETLLHEMIHALLFVTQNNKDHNAHGPEFCKHMRRINAATGSNITIYHNFRDEVDHLRQHWWRCQGLCRTKAPFFGYVRRSMNRAPAARDPWWPQHQRTCGGTYVKVKEPEDYGRKKPGRKTAKPLAKTGAGDITLFLSQGGKPGVSAEKKTTERISTSKLNIESYYNRLGGSATAESNHRGIPSTSRLLTSLNSQTSRPNTGQMLEVNPEPILKSDSEKLNCVSGENPESAENKWTKLSGSKRKNFSSTSGIPMKREKGTVTIPELIDRMKRKSKKSVNAGAPAFKMIPLVARFTKHSLHFQDSEEDSQSEKEKDTPKKNLLNGWKKEIQLQNQNKSSNTSNSLLSSFHSDSKDGGLFIDFATRSDNCTASKQKPEEPGQAIEGTDDCLPLVNFTNDEPLMPRRTFTKRLPSFSDDDESDTLTELWKKNSSGSAAMPFSKKLKLGDEDFEENEVCLPEVSFNESDRQQEQTDLSDVPGVSENLLVSGDVPCPICSDVFPLASINRHIDNCLSLKAIRDSSFE